MQLARQPSVNDFAVALRATREARALSQRALARASGLTPAYISLLEAGRRAPERTTVDRIGEALALDAGERARLLLAAGYAAPSPAASPASPSMIDDLLRRSGLPPALLADATAEVETHARAVIERLRPGGTPRPKPASPAAGQDWRERVLAVIEQAIAAEVTARAGPDAVR